MNNWTLAVPASFAYWLTRTYRRFLAANLKKSMIIIEDLVRRFGTFTAVGGISLRVNRGEVLGFLGPNGAGKSTTMKMKIGRAHV